MFDVVETEEFADWMAGLKDAPTRAVIARRTLRLATGNFGDCKPVGGGVSELRIHLGPGYRVYFTRRGQRLLILLCGGDKSSQKRDIERAQAMAEMDL